MLHRGRRRSQNPASGTDGQSGAAPEESRASAPQPSASGEAKAAAEPAALTQAVRSAAQFDRGAISVTGGLLAAIPVVVLLGGGLALGNPVAAATMSAGAMLVGSAWRTGGGRPPLALMATDAVVMAASTFVGSVSGGNTWIHLGVLCLWSLAAGLLVALGRRGAVLGTQAIIAAVVFGRFSQPALQALGLAGYVLAGGLTQVVFLGLLRWPSPLREQRRMVAQAYRGLAELAPAPADASTLPVAASLDEAQASLAGGALFGDPALVPLRSLVTEGQRVRLRLGALHVLLARDDLDSDLHGAAADWLQDVARALDGAASVTAGDTGAALALEQAVSSLSAEAAVLTARAGRDEPSQSWSSEAATAHQIAHQVAALAGQMRAVCSLAPPAGVEARLRRRGRQRRANRPLDDLRTDLEQLLANVSLDSPAGRHALRLAVVVPAAELVARALPLQRSYWLVVAAATVLRPEFGSTFTRGIERLLGTCLGVGLAGAIAAALHPTGAVSVVLVGVLAWAGYALFAASFAVGFSFITALVVFLLNAISPDTLATASARLLDTLVGGTLGLLAYLLWPTWSRAPARRSLADLVLAQREYLGRVLSALTAGRRAEDDDVRPRARRARLARTQAEAAVAQSLADPATRRIDRGWAQSVLATTRRLVLVAHVLRFEAQTPRERRPLPALRGLAAALDGLLATVIDRLQPEPAHRPADPGLPDLRAQYDSFEEACGHDRDAGPLLSELDELVDAANGLAELVGADPGTRD